MIKQTISTIFFVVGLLIFGLGVVAFVPLIMATGLSLLLLGAVFYEETIKKVEE